MLIGQAVSEEKTFEIVDGRTTTTSTDAGPWVSYKLTYEPLAENIPTCKGVQMSHFHIVHPTGLLYISMHNMPISECNSMTFGKHVPEQYVYDCMSLHLLL